MKNISRVLAVAAALVGGASAARAAYTVTVTPIYTGYWDPTFTTFTQSTSTTTVTVAAPVGSAYEIDYQVAFTPDPNSTTRTNDNLAELDWNIAAGSLPGATSNGVNATTGVFNGTSALTAVNASGSFWDAFNPTASWYNKNPAHATLYGTNADSAIANDLSSLQLKTDAPAAQDRWYGVSGGPNASGLTKSSTAPKGDIGTTGSNVNNRTGIVSVANAQNAVDSGGSNGWVYSETGPYNYAARTNGNSQPDFGRPNDSFGDAGTYMGSVFVTWDGVTPVQMSATPIPTGGYLAIFSNNSTGASAQQGVPTSNTVFTGGVVTFAPEPASMLLLGVGGLLFFRRPRRA